MFSSRLISEATKKMQNASLFSLRLDSYVVWIYHGEWRLLSRGQKSWYTGTVSAFDSVENGCLCCCTVAPVAAGFAFTLADVSSLVNEQRRREWWQPNYGILTMMSSSLGHRSSRQRRSRFYHRRLEAKYISEVS